MGKKQPEKASRGAFTPYKADIDAWKEGTLTPRAKKLNALVDRGFRINHARRNAQVRFDEKMLNLFDSIAPSDQSLTIMSVDGMRRITKTRRSRTRGNANAYAAKAFIDEFIGEILSRKAVSQDEQNMTSFLKAVIQESKGRIMQTQTLVEFRRMQFEDTRLREAQRLLQDAFDVADSKVYFFCEVFDPNNKKWIGV